MNDNPYAGLLKIMQVEGGKTNPPTICIGEVVTPWPEIKIKSGDLVLEKDDLKVADYLTNEYNRKIDIKGNLESETASTGGGSGYDSFASHNHSISSSATLKGAISFTDTLKAGDAVALLPTSDENTYFVLCRVV